MRRRPDPARPARRGFLERALFSFMGPPDVGDPHAPVVLPADPGADLCRRCARSWTDHERVSTGSMTYVRCPEADRQAGTGARP